MGYWDQLTPRHHWTRLSPTDFFVFLKLEMKMKGRWLDIAQNTQKNVTDHMKEITLEEFEECFQWLKESCKKCIESREDYFEWFS
jgi:hypothetical protein